MTVAQRASAQRILGDKGQSVSFSWVTGGVYNPATGAVSGGTTTNVTAAAVILPLDKARKVDGTMIVAGDETLLLSALDDTGAAYEPKVNGIITLADGSKRTLIAIDTLAPAGLTIMFDCVVRRLP